MSITITFVGDEQSVRAMEDAIDDPPCRRWRTGERQRRGTVAEDSGIRFEFSRDDDESTEAFQDDVATYLADCAGHLVGCPGTVQTHVAIAGVMRGDMMSHSIMLSTALLLAAIQCDGSIEMTTYRGE
ncbi:MAG: hypothetical protein KDA25_04620 [Phycisphaerales bacterium]|nr:hypothetical protein [Phycisphaerales bacterium]